MKILDFNRKGNVIKFYLGDDELTEWYGDDWDDSPYQHNAGTVYDRFFNHTEVYALPYEVEVMEAADDWRCEHNHFICKNDFFHKTPALIIMPKEEVDEYWTPEYLDHVGNTKCLRIYYGDNADTIFNAIKKLGGIYLE